MPEPYPAFKMDKSDVKRFREFVDEMVDGIAIAGRNSARWNNRDVIAPSDLPITKGLQERMREFGALGAKWKTDYGLPAAPFSDVRIT